MNLREILENHTGGEEGNLSFLLGILHPIENLFHIVLFHGEIVTVSDGTLEKDSDGVWEFLCESEKR